MKYLNIVLAVVLACALLLLFVVGFDNVLADLRSRVTIFLVLGPIFLLFCWSAYRTFRPAPRKDKLKQFSATARDFKR